MRIEILTMPGCPNRTRALDAVVTALASLRRSDVEVLEREIADERAAEAAKMGGSPTILVNGLDLFSASGTTPSMSCRLYREGDSVSGAPSAESLVERLHKAVFR
jgi:hypothetical protein